MPKKRAKKKTPSRKFMSVIHRTQIPLLARDAFAVLLRSFDQRNSMAILTPLARWHRLDFNMQQQQQTEWCWAAVGASVALYYDPASTWTQCRIATQQLHLQGVDCCDPANSSGVCNTTGRLQETLVIVGYLHPPFLRRAATFAEAQAEVDGGTPLGVRVAWTHGAGAHFLAIIGYHALFQMVAVDDPLYGKSDLDYTTLCTDYGNGGGVWTHTYRTQS
jgi:papain like cysteine protease AvrRpt2